MTTKYYHGVMNDVDDNGNVKVLYPKTYISDVIMENGQSLSDHLTAEDDTEFNFSKINGKYGFMDSEGNFVPFKRVQASKTVTASTSAITVTADDDNDGIANITVNPTPSQGKSVTPTISAQTIEPDAGKLLSSVTVDAISTQTKSATPSTSTQTITPDSGKLLSSVSVGAIPTQTKTITSSTTEQTVTPDSGKYLTQVTVNAISTQEKTVTGSRSAQTVTPDSGKVLTKVTVNKYPDASGTYGTITTNGTHDMGSTNNYRYADVLVPFSISGVSLVTEGSEYISCSVTNGKYYIVYITLVDGDTQNVSLSGCTVIGSRYTGGYNRHGHNVVVVKATSNTISSSTRIWMYAVLNIY